jgi:hypothetical protein
MEVVERGDSSDTLVYTGTYRFLYQGENNQRAKNNVESNMYEFDIFG